MTVCVMSSLQYLSIWYTSPAAGLGRTPLLACRVLADWTDSNSYMQGRL